MSAQYELIVALASFLLGGGIGAVIWKVHDKSDS